MERQRKPNRVFLSCAYLCFIWVLVQSLPCGNEFFLHVHWLANQTNFHVKGLCTRTSINRGKLQLWNSETATPKLPFTFVTTGLRARNNSYVNKFWLHVHFHANQTHFRIKVLHVLKQGRKVTREWPGLQTRSWYVILLTFTELTQLKSSSIYFYIFITMYLKPKW